MKIKLKINIINYGWIVRLHKLCSGWLINKWFVLNALLKNGDIINWSFGSIFIVGKKI